MSGEAYVVRSVSSSAPYEFGKVPDSRLRRESISPLDQPMTGGYGRGSTWARGYDLDEVPRTRKTAGMVGGSKHGVFAESAMSELLQLDHLPTFHGAGGRLHPIAFVVHRVEARANRLSLTFDMVGAHGAAHEEPALVACGSGDRSP